MNNLNKYFFILLLYFVSTFAYSSTLYYFYTTKTFPITKNYFASSSAACSSMAQDHSLYMVATGYQTAVVSYSLDHVSYDQPNQRECDYTIHYTTSDSFGQAEILNADIGQVNSTCETIPLSTTNLSSSPTCATPTPLPICPIDVNITDIMCQCNYPYEDISIFNTNTLNYERFCRLPPTPLPTNTPTFTPTGTETPTPTPTPSGTTTPTLTPTPCANPSNDSELIQYCGDSQCSLSSPSWASICNFTPTPQPTGTGCVSTDTSCLTTTPSLPPSPLPTGIGSGGTETGGVGSGGSNGTGGSGGAGSGVGTATPNPSAFPTPTPDPNTTQNPSTVCAVGVFIPDFTECDCPYGTDRVQFNNGYFSCEFPSTPSPSPSLTPSPEPSGSPTPPTSPPPTPEPSTTPLGTPTPNGGGGGSSPSPNSSSGGDNCDNPPSCSGDEILCNQLKQQWHSRCDIINSELPDTSSAGTIDSLYTSTDSANNAVMNFADIVNTYNQTENCPAPIVISLSMGSYEVTFNRACQIMEALRPLVLSIFLFMSARILLLTI